MKKILIAFLLITLSIIMVACTKKVPDENLQDGPIDSYDVISPITYKFTNNYNFGSKRAMSEDTLSIDYTKFVSAENTNYDKDLAKLGILLSSEMYEWADFRFKDDDIFTVGKLYDLLKFKDVETISPSQDNYLEDKNDLETMRIAHYDFVYNKKSYQIFFLIFKGTDRDFEWLSNLDMGADSDEYLGKSTYSEWTNKENHKGFDIATNRMVAIADNYIAKHTQSNSEQILYISGHSRGGAIANLCGKHYSDLKQYKTFCYTFASATTTTSSNTENYKNIFNIINTDDVVTQIAPSYLGFKRYGIDIAYCVNDYSTEWKSYTGADYTRPDLTSIMSIIPQYIQSRESVYQIPTEYIDPLAVSSMFSTQDEAQQAKEAKIKLLDGLDWESVLEFSDILFDNETSKYYFKWKVAPAYVLNILATYMTDKSILDTLNYVSFVPTVSSTLVPTLTGILSNKDSIEHPHVIESYIVLVNDIIK